MGFPRGVQLIAYSRTANRGIIAGALGDVWPKNNTAARVIICP